VRTIVRAVESVTVYVMCIFVVSAKVHRQLQWGQETVW